MKGKGNPSPSGSALSTTIPHEVKVLSENEKKAYRYLLYDAMLDIRALCQSRGTASWNPLVWRRQYLLSRVAGALADWLHNLAQYATSDFTRLDTAEFWFGYDWLCRRFDEHVGAGKWIDYRAKYARHLARVNETESKGYCVFSGAETTGRLPNGDFVCPEYIGGFFANGLLDDSLEYTDRFFERNKHLMKVVRDGHTFAVRRDEKDLS